MQRLLLGLIALLGLLQPADAQRWRPAGFRPGLSVLGGVSIPAAPGYIASVASAPYAAYGAQRVVSGYPGPLFQLRRASDAATMDVSAQAGGDYPDYAAITSWIGASIATVTTIYDQSGNSRHIIQATVANQPSFDPTQKFGNVVPILFDGYGRSSSGGLPQTQIAKSLSVGGLTGLDGAAMSFFQAIQPQVSLNSNSYINGESDPAGTEIYSYRNGSTGGFPLQIQEYFNSSTQAGANSGTVGGAAPKTTLTVIGFASGTANWRHFQNGTDFLFTRARTSTAIPRLTFGKDVQGGVAYNAMNRLFGMVVYPAQLSQADGQSVVASLNTAFPVMTSPAYRVVYFGDSILEGSGESLLMNTPSWLAQQQTQKFEGYNASAHGQVMSFYYGQRTNYGPPLYTSSRMSVAFVELGTNDLGASTTGSNLYTNSTGPMITYLKSLGYKVVICTILPRSDAAWTGAMETERGTYNGLVIANSAGADYVLDLTQNPVMGNAAANTGSTTYYVDKLHPTSLGYRYLAGAPSGIYSSNYTYWYALQQVLGSTP